MDWNHLKTFLAVKDHGTLEEAARHLQVSHTTAFRHLRAFENALGSQLFDRISGRYQLSAAGEEMLTLAHRISGGFDEIERRIAGRDIQAKGLVTLTAPTSFSYSFLPDYIAACGEAHPDIRIELLVTNQELNMSRRTADVALRVSKAPPDHLVGRQVASIEWAAYACDAYLKNHGTPKDLEDLKAHCLIGATGDLSSHAAFVWMDKHASDSVVQRCDELVSMAHFAAAGRGLALLPDDVRMPGFQRCFTFTPAGRNKVWLLTHPDLRNVTKIRIVMRFLASALSSDVRLQPENRQNGVLGF